MSDLLGFKQSMARGRFMENFPPPFSKEKMKCLTYEDFVDVRNYNRMVHKFTRINSPKEGLGPYTMPPPPTREAYQLILDLREDRARYFETLSSSSDDDDDASENSEKRASAGCSDDVASGRKEEKLGSKYKRGTPLQLGPKEWFPPGPPVQPVKIENIKEITIKDVCEMMKAYKA